MSTIGPAGVGQITSMNIQDMDLETAMMAVQSNRANLLENQLKSQIESVQKKNDSISKMNEALGQLNAVAAQFGGSAKAGDKIGEKLKIETEKQINDSLQSSGLSVLPAGKDEPLKKSVADLLNPGKARLTAMVARLKPPSEEITTRVGEGLNSLGKQVPNSIHSKTTKGELDGAIQQIKSAIDSASNSQQMDMLRLQSLSNKRNEAFETMTNFIKKMQDSRSSIVSNMR